MDWQVCMDIKVVIFRYGSGYRSGCRLLLKNRESFAVVLLLACGVLGIGQSVAISEEKIELNLGAYLSYGKKTLLICCLGMLDSRSTFNMCKGRSLFSNHITVSYPLLSTAGHRRV